MKTIDDIIVRTNERGEGGNDACRHRAGNAEGRNPDLRVFSGPLEAALWLERSKGRFRINRWWEEDDEERFTPNLKTQDALQLPHLSAELAYYCLYYQQIDAGLRRKLAALLEFLDPVCLVMEALEISHHVPRRPQGDVPAVGEELIGRRRGQSHRREPHDNR